MAREGHEQGIASGTHVIERTLSVGSVLSMRANHHQRQAEAARSEAEGLNSTHAGMHHVAAALHDLGVTFAAANMPASTATMDAERAEALANFRAALEAHGMAVEKASKGLSPWGEILAAKADLARATDMLESLL